MKEGSYTFKKSTNVVAAEFLPENRCSTATFPDRWFVDHC
jgi:hypothetical protein